ncbi:MAG: hypothetical protein C5B51_30475 [Terriglobia bacterium]|nr:MAG: hypothetical protein C5B51_30475 [Terriglobia bacterium]
MIAQLFQRVELMIQVDVFLELDIPSGNPQLKKCRPLRGDLVLSSYGVYGSDARRNILSHYCVAQIESLHGRSCQRLIRVGLPVIAPGRLRVGSAV